MEKLQEALRQIIDRLSAVETSVNRLWSTRGEDNAGVTDQFRGALHTISDIEIEIHEIKEALSLINADRRSVWNHHDEKCKTCMTRFKELIDQQIDKWHEAPCRMPFIGFLRYYWWQVGIISIVASAFLQLNERILQIIIKFLSH